MTKEKFEELKERFKKFRKEELSRRVGYLWGTVEIKKDLTREEILELMNILFERKVV